jgi:hypothetical protein
MRKRRRMRKLNRYGRTIQYSTVNDTVKYNKVQYNTVKYHKVQYNTLQYSKVHSNVQYNIV